MVKQLFTQAVRYQYAQRALSLQVYNVVVLQAQCLMCLLTPRGLFELLPHHPCTRCSKPLCNPLPFVFPEQFSCASCRMCSC